MSSRVTEVISVVVDFHSPFIRLLFLVKTCYISHMSVFVGVCVCVHAYQAMSRDKVFVSRTQQCCALIGERYRVESALGMIPSHSIGRNLLQLEERSSERHGKIGIERR